MINKLLLKLLISVKSNTITTPSALLKYYFVKE